MKVQDTLEIEPHSRCRNCTPSGHHAHLLVGLQISGLHKDGSTYKCSFSDGAQSIEGFFGSKVSMSICCSHTAWFLGTLDLYCTVLSRIVYKRQDGCQAQAFDVALCMHIEIQDKSFNGVHVAKQWLEQLITCRCLIV